MDGTQTRREGPSHKDSGGGRRGRHFPRKVAERKAGAEN